MPSAQTHLAREGARYQLDDGDDNDDDDDDDSDRDTENVPVRLSDLSGVSLPARASRSCPTDSADSDDSEDVLDTREKYLVFTMGSSTYTPHQIGLKRVAPFTFCRRIDIGLSLAERVEIQRRRESLAIEFPA